MEDTIDLSKPKSHLKEFDKAALWEKHSYAELTSGEIVMLVPVTVDRTRDTTRSPKFYSSVLAVRSGQQVNLPFEIEGVVTLEAAIDRWLEVAEATAAEFHRKAEEQAIRSRLSVPMGARMPSVN